MSPTSAPINDSFGYNFQAGNFVFGLEGALSAANFDGRFTSPFVPEVGGWTAGVGLEYQLTPKLSLGLEYLYTDLGGSSSGAPASIGSGSSLEVYNNALKTQSLLGRLNYKAGW
jgi:opacity protein-like surface antigen